MQGLISGIKRMEIHDGDGLRTTVFFKGCPLRCKWCHNPESISKKMQIACFQGKCIRCGSCVQACARSAISMGKQGVILLDRTKCTACGKCAEVCPTSALEVFGRIYEIEGLIEELLMDKPFFDQSGGGVTLSGGECLAQGDFATELARGLFAHGVNVNVDTCGFVSREVLTRILPYTDMFLYDVKTIDGELHKRLTGLDNTLILQNLRYLTECGARVEVRIPLVVGENDGEIERIGIFLKKLKDPPRVKVLQYHDFSASRYEALDMENTLPKSQTSALDVENAVRILRSYGLQVVNE